MQVAQIPDHANVASPADFPRIRKQIKIRITFVFILIDKITSIF
jgi:hypothetical protein